jgi:hypothetical protein
LKRIWKDRFIVLARCSSGICLERLRKFKKNLRILGVPFEIPTHNFLHIYLQTYHYKNMLGGMFI